MASNAGIYNGTTEFIYNYVTDGSGNITYVGQARIGTPTSSDGWMIKNITYDGSGNPVSIRFAEGSQAMNKVMDNYASYAYS